MNFHWLGGHVPCEKIGSRTFRVARFTATTFRQKYAVVYYKSKKRLLRAPTPVRDRKGNADRNVGEGF